MEIGGAVKDLGAGPLRFVYSWVLPSGLAAVVFLLFVLPDELSERAFQVDNLSSLVASASLIGLVTVTVSTSVGLLSLPIYRFLEGYTMPKWLARPLRRRQLVRRRRLQMSARRAGLATAADVSVEKLGLYPERPSDVLPTRLGNGLRAFERYGEIRFGLDSQSLWYELVATAPPPLRSDIDEARAPVDFFVSVLVHLGVLSVSSWVVFMLDVNIAPVVVAVTAAALMPMAYAGAVRNVNEYAQSVRALVNLGRLPLASALGLRLPVTAAEEQQMWDAVTDLTAWHRDGSRLFGELDRFRSPTVE